MVTTRIFIGNVIHNRHLKILCFSLDISTIGTLITQIPTVISFNSCFLEMAPKTRTVVREGVDVIASGGMDDIVRLWDVTPDGELKLKYKLPDHSLGVVSVALNKEVTRELPFFI